MPGQLREWQAYPRIAKNYKYFANLQFWETAQQQKINLKN